jgi:hypothetical protein
LWECPDARAIANDYLNSKPVAERAALDRLMIEVEG